LAISGQQRQQHIHNSPERQPTAGTVWLLPGEIGGLLSHALPVQLPRKRYHRLAIFHCGRHLVVHLTVG
jgi:hypothetical protein